MIVSLVVVVPLVEFSEGTSMIFNRFASLVLSGAIVLSLAVSIGAAWCGELATQEQNLALLKAIEADLAKKPDNTLLQLQHAEMLGLLKRYEEQVAEANKLLKKNPNLRDAYLIRSDGEANQKQYAAPTPKLLLSKARYLRNEKRYAEAIETVNRIIEVEPSNVDAYKCRSACYFRLNGPCEQALRDMEKVVSLNPSDAPAKSLVADLKREIGLKASTAASHVK